MGPQTRSSERHKWDKIFEGLVKMLKTQQQHLETLAKERKILESRIKMQYERWVSDVRLYEDYISQMKGDLELEEMARVLEAKKADMMVGLKQREAYLFKLKLQETEDELSDFRVWFDILSKNQKDISQKDPKETKKGSLEGDLRKLKLECENLVSEKSSEIAALVAENKFAWNQLNLLESKFTDKLNSKHAKLEKANGKIETLMSDMEELRLSNAEKDKIIERLKAEVAQRDADASKLHEEVSKMSREIELRKSKSASCAQLIKPCTASGRTLRNGKNVGMDGGNVVVKKETSSSLDTNHLKDSGKGSRSLKRKKDDVITISETPRLFTSRFKVPRLKVSSSKTG